MKEYKIRGNDLLKLGYKKPRERSLAMDLAKRKLKYLSCDEVLTLLENIKCNPQNFLSDSNCVKLANDLIPERPVDVKVEGKNKSLEIFGKEQIDPSAIHQMYQALNLPVSVRGALMPDAHVGYGLPIGGVLEVENAIIPYAVGVDIGCMMSMSIFAISPERFDKHPEMFEHILFRNTCFGQKEVFDNPVDHPVFYRQEFEEIPLLKYAIKKARKQIGTSGGGNHFVEFASLNLSKDSETLGIPMGEYVALLSHSGSRSLGASVARQYSAKAMLKQQNLDKSVRHMSWLSLDSEEGIEYWKAMHIAGDYAKACHEVIHHRIATALGERPLANVQNHHNYAWETSNAAGSKIIVHRKGASPAKMGEWTIIPGSMATNGYLAKGLGNKRSLSSASHGAGRVFSRSNARNVLDRSEWKKSLKEQKVRLIGGSIEEAPKAYKDINDVIRMQNELIDIYGSFKPRIVRMKS